jgi:spermidine dehydrogenase
MKRKARPRIDRSLGEDRRIPRRDFLQGALVAAEDSIPHGITVNRWPHGYAHEFNPLFEPVLPPEQQPNVIGRAKFGRITIANSDAGAAAYTDSAIDQAHRAVAELLSG